jgi:hypothetical protein
MASPTGRDIANVDVTLCNATALNADIKALSMSPDSRGEGEEKSPYIGREGKGLCGKTKEIIVSYLDHSLYALVQHVACVTLPDRAAYFVA